MTSKRFLVAVLATVVAMPAFAHPGGHVPSGFVDGFRHPLGGLDHTLAMLAVGLFAALLGGRALWAVPASFVIMMLAGGVIGIRRQGPLDAQEVSRNRSTRRPQPREPCTHE
jgi:urease accessory protein